ncbi:hypothetical protein ACXYTJ_16670 [Gilvimarinus sp. F26214L]|uniref:hypothetical protein n=1 Tax=Gilvimarinus sp. DZF01 TaxID=3461371 RepID=UPI0040455EFC
MTRFNNNGGTMLRTCKNLALIATASLVLGGCATNSYTPPRLADGSPDLQGVWTNASLTTLTRSSMFKSLTITPEQAQRIADQRAAYAERDSQPTDPNAPAPKKGSVGGYNAFWTDSGSGLAMIDGAYRTSWIVDPKDGKLPYSEEGRARFEKERNEARNNFDGPEIRPMPERCVIGFGSTGGPPMMNVLYNNNYQIVQTPDQIAILVEMNHDARIIRMDDSHNPQSMRRWLGDSVGHWDGDTLVIETRNFKQGESLRLYFDQSFYISENAVVTERLTRTSEDELFYEFEVDDPDIYTQAWRGEMIFKATDGPIYEYACHEGNYALPNILGGARQEEREQAAQAAN